MMRATRSARLKRLHQALSEGLPVSLNDLIDIAGADRASVVSDLRHLRSDLGAPLRFSDGGYRYLTSYELPVLAVCLENYELQSSVESEGPELAWSAQHMGLDQPVQVRAMLGGPEVAHHMEVRSRTLARLSHPGILPIYDRGQIDEVTAFESDGQFEDDMRWIALPASYETDLSTYSASSWKRLLESILTLLEATAYAHAHDSYLIRVLPAQVLASIDHKSIALSHLIPSGEMDALLLPDLVGACFQAPERNEDWMHMPTVQEDLYALGSLIWFMISGEIPHGQARGVHDLVELQKQGDPNSLPAEFSLPKGFRNWLAMMRSPNPENRFTTVADCRASLLEVDRLRGAQRWQPVLSSMPSQWQRSWTIKPDPLEQALGLNLIGLRPLPFVARVAERDRLWSTLHEAIMGKTVSGCVLRSAAGIGKSRLLGWVKHRAMETGAAQVVRVRCNPAEAPGLSMSTLVLRSLGLSEAEPELSDVLEALSSAGMTNRYEQDALASIVAAPYGWSDWPSIRFERSHDRFGVIARLLRRLSIRRALVILVDDAQWSLEILAVFRQLFSVEGHRNLRIFFAVAVRDETDESTSALEQRQLNDLLSERRVTLLELDRLRAEDLEEMLHRRLGMLPALTEKAMQWCAGSPMMAHQLIESWHTEGVLVGSLQGIGHQNPDGIALPSNFARLWTQRLDQVLEPLDESLQTVARWALEAGALLGRSVDNSEWSGMCRQLGFEPPEDVIAQAVSAGLLWPTASGWRFQHGTLRDALLLESEAENRLVDLHRAIAEFLSSQSDSDLGTELRCGEHLLAAGDHHVAFEILLKAEALAREARNDLAAERAIELADQAAQGLSSDRLSPQNLDLQQRKADLLRLKGEWDEAEQAALKLEALAEEMGESEALVIALRIQAQCAFEHAQYEQASDLALRAQVVAQDVHNMEQAIHCELLLGMIFGAQSQWDQAITFYQAALKRINGHCPQNHELQGACLFHLGMVHQERGELSKALPLFIKSLQHWEKCGGQRGLAGVANALADAARSKGRLDRAMDWYGRAKRVYDSIGAWEANIVRLNLALVMMFDDRFEDAHSEVLSCFENFRKSGQESWIAVSYVFALPGLANLGEWKQFGDYFSEAVDRLNRLQFADADLARVFEIAGELAGQSEENRRADMCFEQAAQQWRILDCPAEANAAALRAGIN